MATKTSKPRHNPENPEYDPKFIRKIKSQEGTRGVRISSSDLWIPKRQPVDPDNWCFPRPDGSRPTKEEFIAHMEAAERSPGISLRQFKKHMDKWIEKKLSSNPEM